MVERREVEVVEKRAVNSPPELRRCRAVIYRRGKRRDPENIRAHTKDPVGRETSSGDTHQLVAQSRPVGRPIHDVNSARAAFDPQMNSTDCRRRQDDVTRWVSTDG
jgi:hypothetical protein